MTRLTARRCALLILVGALALPLAACSNAPLFPGQGNRSAEVESLPGAVDEGAVGAGPSYGTSVIQTATVALEVTDAGASAGEVSDIAEGVEGHVTSQTVQAEDEWSAASAYLVVRVPADRLDETLDALTQVGEVLNEQRTADDVTAQHADLTARVEALQASVERLLDLMSEAATTSELIEAESALAERQQELDGLRAQLEALEDQVDLATLNVSLTEHRVLPAGPVTFWDGLLTGLESLAVVGTGALVVLGVLTPWLLLGAVVAVAVVLIVRVARRRSRPRPAPTIEHSPMAERAGSEEPRG